MRVQLPKGWALGALEVAHERFPRPLTAREIRKRDSYAYPHGSRTLLPRLERGFLYPDGTAGEVAVSDGLVRATINLDSGSGNYWVIVYADRGAISGKSLSPVAAVRISAD